MGTAAAREAIRDALATLKLDALAYPPPTPSAGQAWPQWVSSEISGYCSFTHTWEVYLAVGGATPQSSAQAVDVWLELIAHTLADVGVVVLVEPVLLELTDNANQLPCLRARLQTT